MDPEIVAVAGDWHGNTRWATTQIAKIGALLSPSDFRYILHTGDFGIWPGRPGDIYINAVIGACLVNNLRIWFVDGNHEDFDQIGEYRIQSSNDQLVSWLPRGHRWTWHGRKWLAMGGAASVDRAIRVEKNWGWWPQEYITDDQIADAIEDGPADVLLSHDAPTGAHIVHPPPAGHWDFSDMAKSEENQARLQVLCDAVWPKHIIHGHHHTAYQKTVHMAHGDVEITGLANDGEKFNWGLLNVRDMTWEMPDAG